MAATVVINRWTGVSSNATKTAIQGTTNRAGTADDPNPGTSYPIPVPASGVGTPNYSYWVCTRLAATSAPTTAIQNLYWYTDGANGMGTGIGLNVATASAYAQASGTQGTSGTVLSSSNYGGSWTYSSSAANDAFTNWSSGGTKLTVPGSIGNATGDIGQFVVYQVSVASTAGPGTSNAETLTFQYDET